MTVRGGRIDTDPTGYTVNTLDLLDQAQQEQRKLESRIAELEEMLALAANNTAAGDLAQDVEFMRTKMQTAIDAFAEWESVRTFRNDINSHEWLALVDAMTGLEHEHH